MSDEKRISAWKVACDWYLRAYYTEDEPFSTLCCGMRMCGDIVLGDTLCPYCELPVTAFDDEEIEVIDD